MKNKVNLLVLFFLSTAFFISGCKKDKTIPTPKIKTITTGATTNTYQYDAQGRIARITQSGVTGYTSYEYKGSDSLIIYSFNGTDSSRYKSCALSNGLVSVESLLLSTNTYTYNGNGYPIYSATNSIFTTTNDTFNIVNNNVSKHRSYTSGFIGFSSVEQSYTYLTDKTNSVNNTSMGMSFLGKSNANPVDVELYYSYVSNIVPPATITNKTYKYTYEFDANGWITKMTKTDVAASTSEVTTYTYY